MAVIETHSLTKSYGQARGIIDVNLIVNEGEFFGFIGPNGAGKSTTIRTLLGLIKATSGSAEVFGLDIAEKRTEILSRLGYMPSEAMFYRNMRVKDILSLSAKLRKCSCEQETALLCKRLDLDSEKRISDLSLGNRKKVAIVCALQHKPELYIFDEPTSGLDPLIQKEFFDILNERRENGATIFLSSHVLSEIQRNCDRAGIIKDGQIITVDNVENLSKTGAKRISLHGVDKIPSMLEAKSVTRNIDSISFLYNGDVKKLLKIVEELPITDLTITEPDLDEVFLHYYIKEESV